LAIDFFRSLFCAANIGPRRSRRIQGTPLEDPKDYTPLIPNSLEGSPEGAFNIGVASKIVSSTPLKESIIPMNLLLSVAQDPHFLWINSSGDIIADEYIEITIEPHAECGVDDPFFQSESFRTLVHTVGKFNPITPDSWS